MQELLCLGAAYIAGLIASRLFFPPLVGYLVAGYVLNILKLDALDTLTHFADVGIELLLFTVGLKLDLSSLLRQEILRVGGLHLISCIGCSFFYFRRAHYWRTSVRGKPGFFQYCTGSQSVRR